MIDIRIVANNGKFDVEGTMNDTIGKWELIEGGFAIESDAKELVTALWNDVVVRAEAKAGWDPNP